MKKLFKVKGRRWSVETVPSDSELLIRQGEPCLAQIFLKTRNIYIDEVLLEDEDSFYDTLIHELTHCHIESYAIDRRQFRDEEFICEFMMAYGAQIVDLTRDLMPYFFEKK